MHYSFVLMRNPSDDEHGSVVIQGFSDISVLSDASLLSDEGGYSPKPTLGDTTGKQVRFNSAVAISSSQDIEHKMNLGSSQMIRPSSCLKVFEYLPRLRSSEHEEIGNLGEEVIRSSPNSPLAKCHDTLESTDSILDLSLIDDFDCQDVKQPAHPPPLGSLAMGKPQYNTICSLQTEVMQLAERISDVSAATPGSEAQQKALNRLTGRYDASSLTSSSSPPRISSIPVAVNFDPKDSLFVNLLDISVSESEIVRGEQDKLARKRKQVVEALKKNAKPEILPEPDLMKFFDPRKHVFQSARVYLAGLPDLLPPLRPFPGEQLHFIHSPSRDFL